MTLQELIREIQQLSAADRTAIMNLLSDLTDEPKMYSILDFQGIGQGALHGADAQDYVSRLRDEWDEREREFRK